MSTGYERPRTTVRDLPGPYGRMPSDEEDTPMNDYRSRPRAPRPAPKTTFLIDQSVSIKLDPGFAQRLGQHIIEMAGTEDKQIMAFAYQLANLGPPPEREYDRPISFQRG